MPQSLNDHEFVSLPFEEEDGSETTLKLRNYAIDDVPATVSLRFFNLIDELVSRISRSTVVVGCSPWFASPRVAVALREVEGFSLVTSLEKGRLRKESKGRFPIELAKEIQQLNVDFAFKDWKRAKPVEYIQSVADEEGRAVQRLHSKFLVFLTRDEKGVLKPNEVAMGSANFTENADLQHETLCFVKSPKICDSMILQWYQMLMVAGYQRDKRLLHFGETMAQVQEWNRQPYHERYPYDVEAALFEPDDYYNGKRTGPY